MTRTTILTDATGRPFPEVEPPTPGAPIEDVVAFLRAHSARVDAVAAAGSRAFDRQFRRALRRR